MSFLFIYVMKLQWMHYGLSRSLFLGVRQVFDRIFFLFCPDLCVLVVCRIRMVDMINRTSEFRAHFLFVSLCALWSLFRSFTFVLVFLLGCYYKSGPVMRFFLFFWGVG